MSNMVFVDTHTHIYDEQFEQEESILLEAARNAGVRKLLMPNCDVRTIQPMLDLAHRHPQMCLPMIGLHPIYVQDDFEQQLKQISAYFDQQDFVAVGEVGLDFFRDTTFAQQQQLAFETQIHWADERDLPLVIHTRSSIREGIDTIKKFQKGQLRGVFHCFSGTEDEAQEIIEDLGFSLGIGGVVTFKNSKLKDIVSRFGLDHLLLETDAPYLAPTPHRGKRNDSSYIPLIAAFMAETLQVPLEEVAQKTTANAQRLFGFEL